MSGAGTTGARILIAEDDAPLAQRLAQLVAQDGYRVTSVADATHALDALRGELPALVVSEVGMREMDGFELCSRIKQDARSSDVPVILVSTPKDLHDVVRALECRADGLVLEPYEEVHLLEQIRMVLGQRRESHDAAAEPGVDIVFRGEKHRITAGRLQILNLLLTTFATAIDQHRELATTRGRLQETSFALQQLSGEFEERVRARTREFEQSHEAVRQSQHALIQQERLRALGQMAGGIAHDINSALSPIALYTEAMLEREPGLSAKTRKYLATIHRAIDDVTRTVDRLRDFYRPREPEAPLADVELNPLVQQVIDSTRARWDDLASQRGIHIEVRNELAEHLPIIRGAEGEIRDALTNLIFNAVDALPQGGRIIVRTRTGADQSSAVLEVIDSGVGMDEETRRRCLEPFFTTKGDRGTGLGLAMVYGMARRHSASLEVESSIGLGTTVRLTFRAGSAQTTDKVREFSPLFAVRSLRVLLVDDDPALLESLRSSLEDEGHKVTTTAGGQAGIDAFRDAQKAGRLFDVVITDLGMPFVDGRKVVAGVRAMSPGTPIILLTGWGHQVAGDQGNLGPVDRVMGKPPRMRELRSALAELTGRRATDRVG